MMSYANSLQFREAGSLIILPVTKELDHESLRHPRTGSTVLLSPLTTATELFVIDLIAQQNPEPNPEFASYGDPGLTEALLHQLAPVETAQVFILAYCVHRRL